MPSDLLGVRGRLIGPVAAALLALTACSAGDVQAPDELTAAAPGVAVAADVTVPQLGPFRRTGRHGFAWSVRPVTAARLGASHRSGCPVSVGDLRLVTVTHWTFDRRTRRGELVVHEDVATSVVEVFRAVHAAGFPLERVQTIERYGADDDRSMATNNTSAYNCRRVTGGTGWSEHAYGRAIDLNPVQNPYVRGTTVEPTAGRAYLDRTDVRRGMIVTGDRVVAAFAEAGWSWGGAYRSLKDYQHFSQSGG